MINIIMAVYNGLEFIKTPLNSLLEQEDKDFILTVVQDFDKLDYTEILNEYRNLGLNINHIKATEHIKQGRARQLGLENSNNCDAIMFLDQDDELFPYTVKLLSNTMKETNADLVFGKYIAVNNDGVELVDQQHHQITTQHHGKLYSLGFLKKYDIKFSPIMKYAEDSYFNFMCFYCADKIQYVDEIVYKWLFNDKSETHLNSYEYYQKMIVDFIYGQCNAIIHTYNVKKSINSQAILDTIINMYSIDMVSRAYNFPDHSFDKDLKNFGKQKFVKDLLNTYDAVEYLINNVKTGTMFMNQPLFFTYSFIDWLHEWLE